MFSKPQLQPISIFSFSICCVMTYLENLLLTFWEVHFLCFTQLGSSSHGLNFNKLLGTAPLMPPRCLVFTLLRVVSPLATHVEFTLELLTSRIIFSAFSVKCGASNVNTWSTTRRNRLEGRVSKLNSTSVNTSTQCGSSEKHKQFTVISIKLTHFKTLRSSG